MAKDPDPRWNLHDTPNPSERSFSVLVSQMEAKERHDALNAYIAGSYFRDFPLIPDEGLVETYGDFRYTIFTGNDLLTLRYYFAQDKTEAEANTPFRGFWKKFGNHRHPPILEALAFVTDPHFPVSTNIIQDGEQGIVTAPRQIAREIFVQEVNEGSRFWIDEFTGPMPFNIGRYPVPQPGRVSYQLPGVSGAFEECLHDDLEIPAAFSATATYIGGTPGEADGIIPGQFFPRTNFRRRRPYVLMADQELRNGVWFMQRIRVFPPKQPRVTIQ